MINLIKKVPENEIFRKQSGADMGSSSIAAFSYSPETNNYKYVSLYSFGSWDVINTSQEAATLKKLFEEILSSYPWSEKCYARNKM